MTPIAARLTPGGFFARSQRQRMGFGAVAPRTTRQARQRRARLAAARQTTALARVAEVSALIISAEMKENEEGELVNKTKTFSNIVPGAGNDAIHAGLSAVAGLMDITNPSVGKVVESTLVSE